MHTAGQLREGVSRTPAVYATGCNATKQELCSGAVHECQKALFYSPPGVPPPDSACRSGASCRSGGRTGRCCQLVKRNRRAEPLLQYSGVFSWSPGSLPASLPEGLLLFLLLDCARQARYLRCKGNFSDARVQAHKARSKSRRPVKVSSKAVINWIQHNNRQFQPFQPCI